MQRNSGMPRTRACVDGHVLGPLESVVSREVVQEAGEYELVCAARVGSYDQASAGAAGSLIGGFPLIVASDSRLM